MMKVTFCIMNRLVLLKYKIFGGEIVLDNYTIDNIVCKQFGGINLRTVKTLPDGSVDLDEVVRKIRNGDDVHQSITNLLCLENTHNRCGGRVIPLSFIRKVSNVLHDYFSHYHLFDNIQTFRPVS